MNKFSLNRNQLLFVLVLVGYTLINFVILSQDIQRLLHYQKVMDHNKIGYQFIGLEEHLVNEQYVGYFTEIDIRNDRAAKLFAQAQFILAPAILDPNNLNHPYVIIVTQKPNVAFTLMQKLNLVPILINDRDGVVLAKRS